MQRYWFDPTEESMVEDESGNYVLYSDASARISTLEAALRLVKDGLAAGHIKSKNIITMDPSAKQITPQTLEEIVDIALGDKK